VEKSSGFSLFSALALKNGKTRHGYVRTRMRLDAKAISLRGNSCPLAVKGRAYLTCALIIQTRWLADFLKLVLICGALLVAVPAAFSQSIQLSNSQAEKIGQRIWQNESGGTISGLTAWNSGENFASLGIGHFIWYPVGKRGPFEESFPSLLQYLVSHGITVPVWLEAADACPWSDRAKFLADQQSPRMKELRSLLSETIALQARFAASRLEQALPKMLEAVPNAERTKIRNNFFRVAAAPLGPYALVDYVNFKGEGTKLTERYRGEGWGLLQVLATMGNGPALSEFSFAADKVLTRRVANSPPERGEKRWLQGWRNRVRTYAE
jgi:hypothetical protein